MFYVTVFSLVSLKSFSSLKDLNIDYEYREDKIVNNFNTCIEKFDPCVKWQHERDAILTLINNREVDLTYSANEYEGICLYTLVRSFKAIMDVYIFEATYYNKLLNGEGGFIGNKKGYKNIFDLTEEDLSGLNKQFKEKMAYYDGKGSTFQEFCKKSIEGDSSVISDVKNCKLYLTIAALIKENKALEQLYIKHKGYESLKKLLESKETKNALDKIKSLHDTLFTENKLFKELEDYFKEYSKLLNNYYKSLSKEEKMMKDIQDYVNEAKSMRDEIKGSFEKWKRDNTVSLEALDSNKKETLQLYQKYLEREFCWSKWVNAVKRFNKLDENLRKKFEDLDAYFKYEGEIVKENEFLKEELKNIGANVDTVKIPEGEIDISEIGVVVKEDVNINTLKKELEALKKENEELKATLEPEEEPSFFSRMFSCFAPR